MYLSFLVAVIPLLLIVNAVPHPPAPPPSSKRAEIREQLNRVDDDFMDNMVEPDVDPVAAFEQIYNPDALIATDPSAPETTTTPAELFPITDVVTTLPPTSTTEPKDKTNTMLAPPYEETFSETTDSCGLAEATNAATSRCIPSEMTTSTSSLPPKPTVSQTISNAAAVIDPKNPIIPITPPRIGSIIQLQPTTPQPPVRVKPASMFTSSKKKIPNPLIAYDPAGFIRIDDIRIETLSKAKAVKSKQDHRTKERFQRTVYTKKPPSTPFRMRVVTESPAGVHSTSTDIATVTQADSDLISNNDYLVASHAVSAKVSTNPEQQQVKLTTKASPVFATSTSDIGQMNSSRSVSEHPSQKTTKRFDSKEDQRRSESISMEAEESTTTIPPAAVPGVTIPSHPKANTIISPFLSSVYTDVDDNNDDNEQGTYVMDAITRNGDHIPAIRDGKNAITSSETYYDPIPIVETVFRPVLIKSKKTNYVPKIGFRPYHYITYASPKAIAKAHHDNPSTFQLPFLKSLRQ